MSMRATAAALILLTQFAQAQPAPSGTIAITQQRAAVVKSEAIMTQALKRPGLLAQYLHMRDARGKDTNQAFRLIFNQYVSWFQSFVGDYAGARAMFSIAQPAAKDDSAAPIADYTAEPALDAIAELAKGHQAIFFNEDHNLALTRTLTVQILAKLRAEGYDTFAAETLYADDTGLARRGYPTVDTGFYTEEPIYAEMVRSALKLGYKVIAYEDESAAVGDARERNQARNLYTRSFGANPHARLVVNAGFMHIQKVGKYFDGAAMAQHFITLSGITPITVEQTVMVPHDQVEGDHPAYRQIAQSRHFDTPVVFRNATGSLWSLRPAAFDVSVVFPPAALLQGRPTWAAIWGLRAPYAVSADLCKDTFPCLVEARYAEEGDDAIPADRLLFDPYSNPLSGKDRVRTSSDKVPTSDLYLRRGRYRIVARDAADHVINRQDVLVRTGSRPDS